MLAGIIAAGLPWKIDVSSYEIDDEKITDPLKICVLADLHCERFGKQQAHLLRIINAAKPDLVIIPGDLFDKHRNYQNVFDLMTGLKNYKVYFTSGNHERHIGNDIYSLRKRLRELNVHVLEDCTELYQKDHTTVEIAGLSDHGHLSTWSSEKISQLFHTQSYRILISHRPDFHDVYADVDCDLIICGHNHGGQWHIPFTHQGIYTPGDGLFPKYTEGLHNLNGRKMVISRGLARSTAGIYRLYNNPEVVFIHLKGK